MELTTINLLTDSNILKQSEKLETKLECKFVLLSNEKEYILIFGPLDKYHYHTNLVEKYCTDRKISSGRKIKDDSYEIYDNSTKINGGGWFRFDFFQKTITAMSLSTAYGRFDETIFEFFKKNNLVFKDFKIIIGR